MVGFWFWGLTFTDVLRIGGLTIIGANYWEVALKAMLKMQKKGSTDQLRYAMLRYAKSGNKEEASELKYHL